MRCVCRLVMHLEAMTTPEQLALQAAAVARVRAARIRRDRVTAEAAEELRQAILDALDTGAQVNDIAAAAQVTRQWIYQIRSND